jgi:hypothetical protein
MIKKTITGNSIDLSRNPRKSVQIKPGFHLKLSRLSFEQHRDLGEMLEYLIDREWFATHPQSISNEESIERR